MWWNQIFFVSLHSRSAISRTKKKDPKDPKDLKDITKKLTTEN